MWRNMFDKTSETIRLGAGSVRYSGKQIASIHFTLVTFTDGSWCDVATGKVHNIGKGTLELLAMANPPEEVERKKEFDASSVILSSLTADVTVEPWDGSTVRVVITGTEEQVDLVTTKLRDTVLLVAQDKPPVSSGSNISIASNIHAEGDITIGDIAVTDGDVTIGDPKPRLKILVLVPGVLPLTVEDVEGQIDVGDLGNDFQLRHAYGKKQVTIGRVASAQITCSDKSQIVVEEVVRTLEIDARGKSMVSVADAALDVVTIIAIDKSEVTIAGVAQEASITAKGKSRVRLDNVNGPLQVDADGRETVVVVNGGQAPILDIRSNNKAHVELAVAAAEAMIHSTGGDVCLKSTSVKLTSQLRDRATCYVNQVGGGAVTASLKERSQFTIEKGRIEHLLLSANSRSSVAIGAKARTAELRTVDRSTIAVYSIENEPIISQGERCTVTVG